VTRDVECVVELISQRIEEVFGLQVRDVQRESGRSPLEDVVQRLGEVVDAQRALESLEDELLAAFGAEPEVLGDDLMDLAQRVNAAVDTRDARALDLARFLKESAVRQAEQAVRASSRSAGRPKPAQKLPPRGAGSVPHHQAAGR
jgi:hypothetical protein